MHDAIAAFLEQTKEAGKHRRGLFLGIVEQHDSATIGLDPVERQDEAAVAATSDPSRWPTNPRRKPRCHAAPAGRAGSADEAKPGKRKNGVAGMLSERP